ISEYYSKDKLPGIADAEGLGLQSFCVGSFLPPGALPMPANAITSAHVVKDFSDASDQYYEVTGSMDCEAAGIDCTQDGGQYDNMPCGSAPNSGVDASAIAGTDLISYVMMAGDGTYCIRVCSGGLAQGDSCNAHADTRGCAFIMPDFNPGPGFSFEDRTAGTPSSASYATTDSPSTASSVVPSSATASSFSNSSATTSFVPTTTTATTTTTTTTTTTAVTNPTSAPVSQTNSGSNLVATMISAVIILLSL
ncbi:hypothetical protein HK100_002420, partial [Physocladia obscura]